MIYCVVPPELGEETFLRLQEHYRDNPNVEVIWERRRRSADDAPEAPSETSGNRRRRRNFSAREI